MFQKMQDTLVYFYCNAKLFSDLSVILEYEYGAHNNTKII